MKRTLLYITLATSCTFISLEAGSEPFLSLDARKIFFGGIIAIAGAKMCNDMIRFYTAPESFEDNHTYKGAHRSMGSAILAAPISSLLSSVKWGIPLMALIASTARLGSRTPVTAAQLFKPCCAALLATTTLSWLNGLTTNFDEKGRNTNPEERRKKAGHSIDNTMYQVGTLSGLFVAGYAWNLRK